MCALRELPHIHYAVRCRWTAVRGNGAHMVLSLEDICRFLHFLIARYEFGSSFVVRTSCLVTGVVCQYNSDYHGFPFALLPDVPGTPLRGAPISSTSTVRKLHECSDPYLTRNAMCSGDFEHTVSRVSQRKTESKAYVCILRLCNHSILFRSIESLLAACAELTSAPGFHHGYSISVYVVSRI